VSSFPRSWATALLGDLLVQIIGGGTPSKSNSAYFTGVIPFMTVKDMTERFPSDTIDHISPEAVENSPTAIIPPDSLIVATRMSLGKIVRPKVATAINQDLKALLLKDGIDKTFIEYWWRNQSKHIQGLGTGTTVKGIRLEDIRNLGIHLPPTNEQKRIADKLDALLVRADACYQATRERIERLTPALLAKAFRGELVPQDPSDEPASVLLGRIHANQAKNRHLRGGTCPYKDPLLPRTTCEWIALRSKLYGIKGSAIAKSFSGAKLR
jgi:type I restriction enzyme S subunit